MKRQTSTDKQSAFYKELVGAIRQTIAELDRGTVGISRDCLWQLTARKISRCPHAPQGTYAAFTARQDFDAIVASKPFSTFVYL